MHKKNIKAGLYVFLTVLCITFIWHNIGNFIENNRPEEYHYKAVDPYDQRELLGAILKDRKNKDDKWYGLPIWERVALSYKHWRNNDSQLSVQTLKPEQQTSIVQKTHQSNTKCKTRMHKKDCEFARKHGAQIDCCDDLSPLDSCLTSLEAVKQDIESINPKFSAKLATGFSGWIRMFHEEIDYESIKHTAKWSAFDLQQCQEYGASKSKLVLLVSAMNDDLPDDPISPLTQCMGGLYILAARHEQKHGYESGFQMGKDIGKVVGGVLSDLTYLYKDLERYQGKNSMNLYNKMNTEALNIANTHMQMAASGGKDDTETMTAQCAAFGINVDNFMDGAD